MSQHVQNLLRELENFRASHPILLGIINETTNIHLLIKSQKYTHSIPLAIVLLHLLEHLESIAEVYEIILPPRSSDRLRREPIDRPCMQITYQEAHEFVQAQPNHAYFDTFMSFARQRGQQPPQPPTGPAYGVPNMATTCLSAPHTSTFAPSTVGPSLGLRSGQPSPFGTTVPAPSSGHFCGISQATIPTGYSTEHSLPYHGMSATMGPHVGQSLQGGLMQPHQNGHIPSGHTPMPVTVGQQHCPPAPPQQQGQILRSQISQFGVSQHQHVAYPGTQYRQHDPALLRHLLEQALATLTACETHDTILKADSANPRTEAAAFHGDISSNEPVVGSTVEPQISSPQMSPRMDDGQLPLPESCSDVNSHESSSRASSRSRQSELDWPTERDNRSKVCPNCGADHQLRNCPKPNTEDGHLQACFECNTTDHAWFQCDDYNAGQYRVFNLIYVSRQSLCPVVHDEPIHELWGNHFYNLDDDIQKLTLRRPGPMTPQFVLRMLHNWKHDQEVRRQMKDEGRLLPWDLSATALNSYASRIAQAVFDPATNPMSHEVFYEGIETSDDQGINVIDSQSLDGHEMNDESQAGFAERQAATAHGTAENVQPTQSEEADRLQEKHFRPEGYRYTSWRERQAQLNEEQREGSVAQRERLEGERLWSY
ncbi:hypothetical protein J7T55_012073 [Diaporthe amygdali]|uniref:uncharacterized protein n=1 Tax=Phomopsis amygdali TaxID=1214568 RepID=UPI0022FE6CB4|nr:uncharacterized protein J7T55_012073 [Diaporthe amygdali]KAJ0123608.1 hypothetical protein J7T55_012073 [Diaporthe amygdali]